ncbi:MAG: prepilin-type N-terminal cleavage/methylation domain-containing protein [Bacillota bacterium]|nr:prepilin-type N-terminal cleavage/methylation domain-containing protein [Bacillota bacterium]
MDYKKTRLTNQLGFTLLEVLAVVAIIGILAAFITPRVANSVENARNNTCQANIKYLEGVLERYKLANGAYPEDPGDLISSFTSEFPICPLLANSSETHATGYYYDTVTGEVVSFTDDETGLKEFQ